MDSGQVGIEGALNLGQRGDPTSSGSRSSNHPASVNPSVMTSPAAHGWHG